MKYLFFFSFLSQFACLDMLKPEEEEEEEEEDEDFKEGDQVGDCYDGEDNDEDGEIDCEDPGCFDKPACNPDTGVDTEDPEPTLSYLSLDWEGYSVTLSIGIENGLDGADYHWGIAETSGSCLDYEGGCWTGEDCFMGYDLNDGTNLRYCHPISDTGATLAYEGSVSNLDEGQETVFPDNSYLEFTTHLIDDWSSAEAPCWVFGDDTSYYDGYEKSCTEM